LQKSTFTVLKMDCPSEENLIRLKLDGLEGVCGLDFDIPGRRLVVFHDGRLTARLKRRPRLIRLPTRLVLPDLGPEGDRETVPAIDGDDGHRQLD
jgi:hypothetical protein